MTMKRNVGDSVYQIADGGHIYESKIVSIYDYEGRTIYDTVDPISGMTAVAFDERAVGTSIFDSFEEVKNKSLKAYGRYTTYESRKNGREFTI